MRIYKYLKDQKPADIYVHAVLLVLALVFGICMINAFL